MRALVVFESMYGNTRAVADGIAAGLAPVFDPTVIPVGEVSNEDVWAADLLVVGGPTHAHGMTRHSSRRAAADAAAKDATLELQPDAARAGVREWLHHLGPYAAPVAVFDTRIRGPVMFTGRASRGIARLLRRRGYHLVAAPQSFLVDNHNRLLDGELDRAQAWGTDVALAAARSHRAGTAA